MTLGFLKKKIVETTSPYDNMIEAKKIVENPNVIDDNPNRYWIVWDVSLGLKRGVELKTMQKAVNIFASKGWLLRQLTVTGAQFPGLYALMENRIYRSFKF